MLGNLSQILTVINSMHTANPSIIFVCSGYSQMLIYFCFISQLHVQCLKARNLSPCHPRCILGHLLLLIIKVHLLDCVTMTVLWRHFIETNENHDTIKYCSISRINNLILNKALLITSYNFFEVHVYQMVLVFYYIEAAKKLSSDNFISFYLI